MDKEKDVLRVRQLWWDEKDSQKQVYLKLQHRCMVETLERGAGLDMCQACALYESCWKCHEEYKKLWCN